MVTGLRILRYVVFVPAALLVSVFAGWIGHVAGSFFGFGVFGGEEYLAWFLSGLTASAAFLIVGMTTAPETSDKIKWILLMLWILLGLGAFLGPIVVGRDPLAAIAGATMIFVAIVNFKTPANLFDFYK